MCQISTRNGPLLTLVSTEDRFRDSSRLRSASGWRPGGGGRWGRPYGPSTPGLRGSESANGGRPLTSNQCKVVSILHYIFFGWYRVYREWKCNSGGGSLSTPPVGGRGWGDLHLRLAVRSGLVPPPQRLARCVPRTLHQPSLYPLAFFFPFPRPPCRWPPPTSLPGSL